MAMFRDLRKTVRESLEDPILAVVFFETENSSGYHFVNVLNLGVQGVLIESDKSFETGIKQKIMMKNPELNQWDTFFCRVAWAQITESEKQYRTGLEFLFPIDNGIEIEPDINGEITSQDIEFLLNIRLLNSLYKNKLCSLLNCLSRRSLEQGTPFISDDTPSYCLYIIQKGRCKLRFRNENGFFQPAVHRREGDIIGDMALLSTEPFKADAVSESEMVVWELPKEKFDEACILQPGLIDFLTGLLSRRLEITADPKTNSIGRYVITQSLGEGRTSFVYKGRHHLLNIPSVIKMIKHNLSMKQEDLGIFKKKLLRISNLQHPNIAQIYDIKEQYRTLFIIMEHLEGETLESVFEKKISIPFDTAMLILAQVCSGLAHAHDQKIIHKHLTPSNIFLSNDQQVTVTDFGFSAPVPEGEFMNDRNIYYMAPEQIEGGKTDIRSDIFSLGVLAYEMLTGRPLLSGEDHQSAGKNLNHTGKMDIHKQIETELPEFLKHFIFKATSKSPEQRYGSIHEIIKDISVENNIFKETLSLKKEMGVEVSALLISHKKNQHQALYRLLDEFCQKALDVGLDINLTGKIQICQKS